MTYQCISIHAAKELIGSRQITIADIRDSNSFLTAHMPNAINVTADNAEHFLATTCKETPLIVCCYHGNSSKGAADYFASKGFKQVCSMDGGFEAWQANN